jgi:hypothetical protein
MRTTTATGLLNLFYCVGAIQYSKLLRAKVLDLDPSFDTSCHHELSLPTIRWSSKMTCDESDHQMVGDGKAVEESDGVFLNNAIVGALEVVNSTLLYHLDRSSPRDTVSGLECREGGLEVNWTLFFGFLNFVFSIFYFITKLSCFSACMFASRFKLIDRYVINATIIH